MFNYKKLCGCINCFCTLKYWTRSNLREKGSTLAPSLRAFSLLPWLLDQEAADHIVLHSGRGWLWQKQAWPQSLRSVLQRCSSSWNPPPNGPTTSPRSTIIWGPRTQAYEVEKAEKDILHPNQNTEGSGLKDSSGSKGTGVNIYFPISWKKNDICSSPRLELVIMMRMRRSHSHFSEPSVWQTLCLPHPTGSHSCPAPWVVLPLVCKESVECHLWWVFLCPANQIPNNETETSY